MATIVVMRALDASSRFSVYNSYGFKWLTGIDSLGHILVAYKDGVHNGGILSPFKIMRSGGGRR